MCMCLCVCVCVCLCLTGVSFCFLGHLFIKQNTFFAEQVKCCSTKAFITEHDRLWLPENFYFQMKIARSGNHTCEKQSVLCANPLPTDTQAAIGSQVGVLTHCFKPGYAHPSLLGPWIRLAVVVEGGEGVPSLARENCYVKSLPRHTKMGVHLRQGTVIKSVQRGFESQRANESSSLSLPCRCLSRELTKCILLLGENMWWF